MDALSRQSRSSLDEAVRAERKLTFVERRFAHMLEALQLGTLDVKFPSGASLTFTGAQSRDQALLKASVHIHSWRAIMRTLKGGSLGLAESYLDGEWSSPNLTALLSLLLANETPLESQLSNSWITSIAHRLQQFANRNSRRGSRRNIAYHYDLGNAFYELWLDPSMTYSAALYDDANSTLEAAQRNKYRRLAEAVGIAPGDHVLEIGCGWGGFAEFAAGELGCRVTGLTLSSEQLAFAQARIARAGLADHVDLHLRDYREQHGRFDRIISIEMLEAVGIEYWPTYFSKVAQLLKPGGTAGIQVIIIEDHRFEVYRRGVDFIQKYIFPGGVLPTDQALKRQFVSAGLALVDQLNFGEGYRKTLAEWDQAFSANIPAVLSLNYDERFIRMWQFYLAYCEAGFKQGSIDVAQYVVQSP